MGLRSGSNRGRVGPRNGVRSRFAAGLAVFAVLFSVALLAGSTSATASTQTSASAATHVVVVGAEQDVNCFNPILTVCNAYWADAVAGMVLEGAYRQLPDFTFEPVLVDHVDVATSPVFSLTYHLRSEAVWSDGVAVGAEDLIFTYGAMVNPTNKVVSALGYDQITGFTRIDAKTVRFDFKRPLADWKSLFAVVLPGHALQRKPHRLVAERDLRHVHWPADR